MSMLEFQKNTLNAPLMLQAGGYQADRNYMWDKEIMMYFHECPSFSILD